MFSNVGPQGPINPNKTINKPLPPIPQPKTPTLSNGGTVTSPVPPALEQMTASAKRASVALNDTQHQPESSFPGTHTVDENPSPTTYPELSNRPTEEQRAKQFQKSMPAVPQKIVSGPPPRPTRPPPPPPPGRPLPRAPAASGSTNAPFQARQEVPQEARPLPRAPESEYSSSPTHQAPSQESTRNPSQNPEIGESGYPILPRGNPTQPKPTGNSNAPVPGRSTNLNSPPIVFPESEMAKHGNAIEPGVITNAPFQTRQEVPQEARPLPKAPENETPQTRARASSMNDSRVAKLKEEITALQKELISDKSRMGRLRTRLMKSKIDTSGHQEKIDAKSVELKQLTMPELIVSQTQGQRLINKSREELKTKQGELKSLKETVSTAEPKTSADRERLRDLREDIDKELTRIDTHLQQSPSVANPEVISSKPATAEQSTTSPYARFTLEDMPTLEPEPKTSADRERLIELSEDIDQELTRIDTHLQQPPSVANPEVISSEPATAEQSTTSPYARFTLEDMPTLEPEPLQGRDVTHEDFQQDLQTISSGTEDPSQKMMGLIKLKGELESAIRWRENRGENTDAMKSVLSEIDVQYSKENEILSGSVPSKPQETTTSSDSSLQGMNRSKLLKHAEKLKDYDKATVEALQEKIHKIQKQEREQSDRQVHVNHALERTKNAGKTDLERLQSALQRLNDKAWDADLNVPLRPQSAPEQAQTPPPPPPPPSSPPPLFNPPKEFTHQPYRGPEAPTSLNSPAPNASTSESPSTPLKNMTQQQLHEQAMLVKKNNKYDGRLHAEIKKRIDNFKSEPDLLKEHPSAAEALKKLEADEKIFVDMIRMQTIEPQILAEIAAAKKRLAEQTRSRFRRNMGRG